MRALRGTVTVGLLLVLTGCGSGDLNSSSIIAQLPYLMQGEWLRDEESNDGGQTWVERHDDLRVTYYGDGTWVNSHGGSGTWSLYRDRLIAVGPGTHTIYFQIRMLSQGRRQENIYYTDSDFWDETDYRCRLTKLSPRAAD